MIWTIKVKLCYSEPECSRTIEIDSESNLLSLHNIIQKAVDFDNDHLFDFYLGLSPGKRSLYIGGPRNWDTFDPFGLFKKIKLSEVWPIHKKGLKCYYLFDFGDEWLFQITKSRKKDQPPVSGAKYPRVVASIGENPEQYPDYDDDEDD